MTSQVHITQQDDQSLPSPLLLYTVEEIHTVITQPTATFKHDIQQFVIFTEWYTTKEQHPMICPYHPLDAPLTDWYVYTPDTHHMYIIDIPIPK